MMNEKKGITVSLNELMALNPNKRQCFMPKKLSAYEGLYTDKKKGQGMTFAEVRHYHPGDDIRHMDWRVTARTGRPHIKMYHQERERPIFIVVDFSASMFFGTKVSLKSVTAAKSAAMLIHFFLSQGDKVGGVIFSSETHDFYKPKLKNEALLPLLHGLSKYTEFYTHQGANSLETILSSLPKLLPNNAAVYIFSDFFDLNDDSIELLKKISAKTSLTNCLVADVVEKVAPKPSQYTISDGTEFSLLDLTPTKNRKEYTSIYHKKVNRLKSELLKAALIELDSLTPLDDLLFMSQKNTSKEGSLV